MLVACLGADQTYELEYGVSIKGRLHFVNVFLARPHHSCCDDFFLCYFYYLLKFLISRPVEL